MNSVHKMSERCMKSELDLFCVPQTQKTIQSGLWIEYYPIRIRAV